MSCQPHALTRLLEEAYGVRGAIRWQLLNVSETCKTRLGPADSFSQHVKATSPPNPPAFEWTRPQINLPDLPDALQPLRPKYIPSAKTESRLRPVPDTAVRKAGRDKWAHEWANVRVPLTLPQVDERHGQVGAQPSTGWEGRGLVEAFRMLAGLRTGLYAQSTRQAFEDSAPSPTQKPSPVKPYDLPTFSALSLHLQRIFPKCASNHYAELQIYPVPPPRATRQNPRTWRAPRRLRPRLVRRIYRLLWDKLVWVKPIHRDSARVGGTSPSSGLPARLVWEKCTYDEMRAYEAGHLDGGKFRGVTRVEPPKDKYSTIRPEDTQWL